jgi:MFS transporter, SP family, arabinose:H+ symporter
MIKGLYLGNLNYKPFIMIQRKVIVWSVIVALGGFIFGFDTVVISGAEQAIQKYWLLSNSTHGFTIAVAIIGTVFGALFGRIPADSIGRKKSLIIIATLFLITSLGTAFVTNWYFFIVLRFIGGLGVGASSVIAPGYISEISPAAARGRLVILFQFNIVTGILIAFLSNLLIISIIGQGNHDAWRYMLGVMAIPSLLFLVLLKFVPESPRWLLLKNPSDTEAERILQIIDPIAYKQELEHILQSNSKAPGATDGATLFSRRYRFPIVLAILIAFFNQTSGINAILYYAPRIFEMTGLAAKDSFTSSLIIGSVNFVFTMVAIFFIDKIGRRKLMFIGSVGLILTLGAVAYAFHTHNTSGYYVTAFLSLYIAFFAFSQGAVIWVFIAEIFPNQVRAKGQSLGSTTHWVMAALVAQVFPYFLAQFGPSNTFLFFTVMMVFQLVFVWKMMPETKGIALEDIEHTLVH